MTVTLAREFACQIGVLKWILNDQFCLGVSKPKDIENLRDVVGENSFDSQKYVIPIPDPIQISQDDESENALVDAMEKLASRVSEKFDEARNKLSTITDEVASKQRIVTQKKALHSHNKQTFHSLTARIRVINDENGSYGKY